ncbi:MAG: LysM peptidoglycan-binding domain-containing protein, partial [Candidatus Schekmanbacteria bacterium]
MKQKLCILLCVISLGGGCAWEKISGVTYQPEEQINPPKKENTTEKKTASIEEKKEIAKTESSIDVPENSIEYDNEPLKEEKESLPKELESLFITAEQFYSKGLDYAEQGKWDLAEEEFENALELLHNSPVREKYPEEVNNFYNELSLDILDKLEQNEDSDIRTREEILLAKIKAKPEEERTIKEKVLLDLRELKFDIPIEVNDKVIRYIEYYTVENKEKFETWLGRSGAYMPILRKIFKEEGLPLDLTYLPIIESAFKTSAYSRARAAGLWQFIPGTARKYGLHITWWVDERRDFEKATRSAAKYLKFLKEELGSWYLALAGYNAGEGRVKRAITYQRTKNFWKLRLPRETMNYIPAFLASVIVAKNPSHYGLNVDYEKPISFEKVTIDRSVDLDTIAKCANTTKEEIKKLNPEIRYWATPPLKEYTIRIPKGRALAFKKAFAKAKDSYSLAWNKYKVRPGDSLYLISRNFGVPIGVIAEANNIRNPRLIRVGQTILVPNKWNRGF